jgi:hypothetical protein
MANNHEDITGPSISDDAKRGSDIINGYYAYVKWEELKDNWIAIRLSDGGSDGNRYLSKREAVQHQSDEFLCAYISLRNCPNGVSPLEMERFLAFTRGAYDAGMRLPDPDAMDGGKDPFMDVAQYDRLRGIINGARY